MEQARGASPPHDTCGCPNRSAQTVRETLRNDIPERVKPSCLSRSGMLQSSSQLLLPSAAAGTPMANQATAAGEAVVGEHLSGAAEAASSKRRRCLAEGECPTEDAVVPLDEARVGRPAQAQEPAKPRSAEVWGTKFLDVQEAGLSCVKRSLSPGRLGGRVAAESTYERDSGDIDNGTGAQWLTQQQAVEEFCLSVQTLRDAANEGVLKVEKRPNPYGATYAPMRLYQRRELHRLAIQIWGDETGVEKERERRREQRWLQRQQRTSGVPCESAALSSNSTGAAATSRRSLPDLRSFLRSTSKRKRERMQHSADRSFRRSAAARPVGRIDTDNVSTFERHSGRYAASEAQNRAAENASAATRASVRSEEARSSSVKANALINSGDVRERAHSGYSEEIVWEEI